MEKMKKVEQGMFPKPKKILAFSNDYKLSAIFQSANQCERMSNIRHQALAMCVKGELLTTHGFYWRELPDEIVIDADDIGKLNLLDFDKAAGNDFKIYATKYQRRYEVILEHEFEEKELILKNRKRGKSKS